MRAKRRVPAPRRSHPAVWTPFADAARVYRCPRRPNGPSCAPQPSGIRRMSAITAMSISMSAKSALDAWVRYIDGLLHPTQSKRRSSHSSR